MPFPTSVDTFPTNVDHVDVVTAADINALQTAVAALEVYVRGGSSSGSSYSLGQFGGMVDGVTNDTVAWQSLITFITNKSAAFTANNGARGVVGAGVSIVVGAINFSRRPGWSVHGAGRSSTIIRQVTDNVPIFNLGSDTDSDLHSWGIDGFQFDYVNSQPAGNTNANPIFFASGNEYEGYVTNCSFVRGSYAMRSGAVSSPWGCYFNMLWFQGGLTIGAMDFSLSSGGMPNNLFGHLYVSASAMVGPIFEMGIQDCSVMLGLEINLANLGPKLMHVPSGSHFRIDSIKLESYTYAASQDLIVTDTNVELDIGTFRVLTGNGTITGAGVIVNAIRGVSFGGHVKVDVLDLGVGTLAGGAVCHAIRDSTTPVTIGVLALSGGWDLADSGSTASQESIRVLSHTRGQLSADKGNADYTVALGDPNNIIFETVLTAPRVVNLPAVFNNNHNGLWYRVMSKGAVNGANTLAIKCNGVTLVTLGADLTSAELVWRRGSGVSVQAGWRNMAASVGLA